MILLSARAVPEVAEISTAAAAIAVTVALALGFYWAKWLRAERDEIRARAALAAVVRGMWAARRAVVVVVLIVLLVLDLWLRGQGRR